MRFSRRFGLPERLLAILLLVAGVDFAANILLFDRASEFALREDDAARVAEHLVIASRILEDARPAERAGIAKDLSTNRFSLEWQTAAPKSADGAGLAGLGKQIVKEGAGHNHPDLRLRLHPSDAPGRIGGAVQLRDGSVLNFRTYASSAWTLSNGRIVMLLLPSLVLAVLAWALFRATLAPLRTLVRASRTVGAGSPEPIAEQGTGEVRELIAAFNQMQQRIHQSMADRTQSMLAIGHDLRTPLARMQLRLERAGLDNETVNDMTTDLGEMRHMLESLQAFVETGGSRLRAERIDVAVMTQTLVDTAADEGGDATFEGLESLEIMARPVSLRRALSNLIENALHYAGNVHVTVRRDGNVAEITFEDNGPGIPPERLDDVLQPFVRLDTARGRDTPGMGLGLPIVNKAIALEKGELQLRNRQQGGLCITVRLPCAPG